MKKKYYFEYLGTRSILVLVKYLPRNFMLWFARKLAKFSFSYLNLRKHVTVDNIRNSFPQLSPEKVREIALKTYHHYGVVFFEYAQLVNMEKKQILDRFLVKTKSAMTEFLENNNGRILLGGHFGSWEALFLYYTIIDGSAGIVKKQNNPLTDKLIQKNRIKYGGRIFYANDPVKQNVDWLKNGKSLVVIGDQDARHHGIFVPFMGRPASTYVGAAVLSMRAKADIYFTHCIRNEDGKYEMSIEKIFTANDGFSKNFSSKIIRLFMNKLEEQVTHYPEQYFWMHKRWKTKAPENAKI